MRIELNDLAGLITFPENSKYHKTPHKVKSCARDIARTNELRVGFVIAKYGHLRIAEIARAIWPTAAWAEQMAQRTCRRMVTMGYLLQRRNALGGVSYVLTRSGAGWLSLHGNDARHTLELSSVGGATFMHRTLATRYLIERAVNGAAVAGEYEMANGRVPFSIERLVRTLKKLPDGLVWRRGYEGRINVEWVEVENAAKPKAELLRLLRVATYAGQVFDSAENAFLGKLTIVFDGSLNHAARLMKVANELWRDLPHEKRIQRESAVVLVSANIRSPLVWDNYISMTLHEYRQKRKSVAIQV